MQRLTFHRYLERYVRSLSKGNTINIQRLVKEVPSNKRLREPLFLYSLSVGKVDTLLGTAADCQYCSSFSGLAEKYKWEDIVKALEEKDMFLGRDYHKIFRSYCSKRDAHNVDLDTKLLMHKRIRALQELKGVSNYRLYTDLMLNPSNTNAFLTNGDLGRLSMEVAEKMLTYMRNA